MIKVRSLLIAGLILVLCWASFSNAVLAALAGPGRFLLAGLLLLHALVFPAKVRRWRNLALGVRTFLLALWGFTLYAVISSVWSLDPRGTMLQAAAFGLMAAVVHTSVLRIWPDEARVMRDVEAIWLIAWVIGTAGLVSGETESDRLSGLFSNANMMGVSCAMAFALGLAVATSRQWRTAVVVAISVPPLLGVLGSESRTALLACVGVLLIEVIRSRWSPISVVITSFGGAALVAAVMLDMSIRLPAVAQRFAANSPNGLLNGRQDAWAFAIRIWRTHEVGGVGFRAGEAAFGQYRWMSGGFALDGAHSSYVQILLEGGLVGSVLMVLILATLAVILWQSPSRSLPRLLGRVLFVGLATAYTESVLVGVGQAIFWIFWLVAGAVVCLSPAERSRLGATRKPVGGYPRALARA